MTDPSPPTESPAQDAVQFWALTDVGRVRDQNEDCFLVDKKLQLFIVCDGMGGHNAGEVASAMAARELRNALAEDRDAIHSFGSEDGSTSRKDILRLMQGGVQHSCSTLHHAGVQDESMRGMGTTLDALLLVGRRGFIGHVGDSRVYLYRQGSLHQLTEDHSLINELLKRGHRTREQIANMNIKNAVTRAVGVYESVEVDVFDFDVLPGDRFLLCSDGLHGYLEEAELTELFESTSEEALPEKLISLANERGGKDNITAIIVKVPESESGVDKLAREVNLKLDMLHKMPLFRFVAYQELVQVVNITDVQSFQAGESVVEQGEEGEELYIVLTGKVKVHSADTEIATLGPGQHFGEMALIDKAPRSAAVTALESTQLLSIKRREFFDLIRRDHDVAVKLLWAFLGVLAKRLRDTSRDLGEARDQLRFDEGFSHAVTMRFQPPPEAEAAIEAAKGKSESEEPTNPEIALQSAPELRAIPKDTLRDVPSTPTLAEPRLQEEPPSPEEE